MEASEHATPEQIRAFFVWLLCGFWRFDLATASAVADALMAAAERERVALNG